MEEKMKQFGEGSLRKLAMDAPTESIFHFEGEDYKEKRKVREGLKLFYNVIVNDFNMYFPVETFVKLLKVSPHNIWSSVLWKLIIINPPRFKSDELKVMRVKMVAKGKLLWFSHLIL